MFQAKEQIDIPTTDVLSWYFDDPRPESTKPIYIDASDDSHYYSHESAKKTIRQLVAGFRKRGLKKGDVVCIHSFNHIDYPILVNGIVGFGGIYSGTNPGYQPYELSHAVRAAGIKYFIVEPELLNNALKAAEETGMPKSNILIFNHGENDKIPKGFQSWRTLLEHGEEDWVRFSDEKTAKSTTAARMFSSGTTGLPKAAYISHYNFIGQHCQVNEWVKKPYKEIRLLPLPMFHVATAPTMHFSPLRSGATTYIMRRFELEPYLSYVQKYKVTDLALVPPMVIAIIMSDLKDKYDLNSVVFATCGAAPLKPEPQARFKKLLNEKAVFNQVWGMTETTCIATNFYWGESDLTGSVGRPVPGMDVKLVDDNNKDITDYDVRGEFCIRGPTVIGGYMDEKATKESWDKDGFFHTGDIVYCDKETKKWYIVDRKKELIKVRGFQVAPPELEAVLLSHEKIVDAAVIGVKFPGDDSEFPRAYVVRRQGTSEKELNPELVKKFMAERLAKFKRLDGGVKFIDEIPKNPSGKILKRELRKMAEDEMKKENRTSKL